MPVHFSETNRAIAAFPPYRLLLLAALATLLALALLFWVQKAQVRVWVPSLNARIESQREAVVVRAPIQGIVQKVGIKLGQHVKKGDLLFHFDGREKEAEIREVEAQIEADLMRLDALGAKFAAQLAAQRVEVRAARRAVDKAELSQDQAAREAQYLASKSDRLQALAREGVISPDEVRESLNALERERSLAFSSQIEAELNRLSSSKTSRTTEITKQEHEAERLELSAKIAANRGKRERLLVELERYQIRAISDATVGEIQINSAGLFVTSQDILATLVPDDPVRVVAHYSPSRASGYLQIGQRARLRLAAFPWTQYGFVQAQITNISQPTRGADLRVEAAILDRPANVELIHGMVGTLETNTEESPPLALILRAIGMWVDDLEATPAADAGNAAANQVGGP
jgi:multidrug resistance efflux pump